MDTYENFQVFTLTEEMLARGQALPSRIHRWPKDDICPILGCIIKELPQCFLSRDYLLLSRSQFRHAFYSSRVKRLIA